eukprot:TRINITY_DN850_c1_g1_i2.p2 TRINITY_DN850_c1_g1~~TRINITY_DN850_c1_g1_i2.p2  ORF type:complete len:243 (-),score=9.10 TRINITY_DN850_c1_g1_i2:702-1430(-)
MGSSLSPQLHGNLLPEISSFRWSCFTGRLHFPRTFGCLIKGLAYIRKKFSGVPLIRTVLLLHHLQRTLAVGMRPFGHLVIHIRMAITGKALCACAGLGFPAPLSKRIFIIEFFIFIGQQGRAGVFSRHMRLLGGCGVSVRTTLHASLRTLRPEALPPSASHHARLVLARAQKSGHPETGQPPLTLDIFQLRMPLIEPFNGFEFADAVGAYKMLCTIVKIYTLALRTDHIFYQRNMSDTSLTI